MVPANKHKETWKVFSVKCGKCGTVVTTRHRYDWDRCKCSAFFVLGNNPPEIGGKELDAVRTLDDKPFFERCRADIFCPNISWHGIGRCKDHLNCEEEDELFIE